MTEVETQQPNNLQQFILDEVFKQSATPEVHKLIEKKIGESIASAVESAFRSYGHIGKQIEEVVKQSLDLADRMTIPTYGTMVMALLRERMDATISDLVKNRLDQEMSEILSIAPRELKISALVEAMVEAANEEDGRWGSHVTFLIEKNERFDWYEIAMDQDEDVKRKDCEIQITLSKDGGVLGIIVDGKDPKKTIRMGPMWGYQKMIFGAYCCGSKIILDDMEPSTYIGRD